MTLAFSCPSCRAHGTAPDALAGKQTRCPRCGGVLIVPDPDRPAPPGPKKSRAAVLLLAGVLLFCSGVAGGGLGGFWLGRAAGPRTLLEEMEARAQKARGERGAEPELTADEQASWEKFRKAALAEMSARPNGGNRQIVGLYGSSWESLHTNGDYTRWKASIPRIADQASYWGLLFLKEEEAVQLARRQAGKPDIAHVAVVDLYSQPAPSVLLWVSDDGKGVKESKTAPRPDLDRGAKNYLRHLQRHPY